MPDILVNNAGDAWTAHSVDTSDEAWQYCMGVNLNSAIRFTRCVATYITGSAYDVDGGCTKSTF